MVAFDFHTHWQWALSLLPPQMDSIEAKAEVYAIGLQESLLTHRRQMGNGPARGFFQFEQGGGVYGLLNHSQTRPLMLPILKRMHVEPTTSEVWTAIEWNDVLAVVCARLLLYTAPWKLPKEGDWREGWRQYMWCWRPGRPHERTWPANYQEAWRAVHIMARGR